MQSSGSHRLISLRAAAKSFGVGSRSLAGPSIDTATSFVARLQTPTPARVARTPPAAKVGRLCCLTFETPPPVKTDCDRVLEVLMPAAEGRRRIREVGVQRSEAEATAGSDREHVGRMLLVVSLSERCSPERLFKGCPTAEQRVPLSVLGDESVSRRTGRSKTTLDPFTFHIMMIIQDSWVELDQ